MGERHLAVAALGVVLAGCAGDSGSAAEPRPPEPAVTGRVAALSAVGLSGPIWLLKADGARPPAPAGSAGHSVWAVAWAPDGRRIAYVSSGASQARSVAVLNVRSGRSRPLLSPPRAFSPTDPIWYQVAWAPRSNRIAVLRAPPGDGSKAAIDVVSERGKTLAANLATDAEATSRISWSPDGRRLAYTTRAGSIRFVTVASGDRASPGSGRRGTDPAWSPNGRWIAFATHRGLAIMRPSGRGFRRLTSQGRMDKTPTWSPDNAWVAFARQTGGCDSPDTLCAQDIYRVLAAGGRAERIRRTPRLNETSPVWSPG